MDLRPVGSVPGVSASLGEAPRFCSRCGVSNSGDDRFCVECGTALADQARDEPVAEPAITTHAGPRIEPQAGRRRLSKRSTSALAATLAIIASAVIVIVLLTLAWRGEIRDREAVEADLVATQTDLRNTRAKLAATETELADATALSEEQGALLAKAKKVLTSVDPLLSSVDELQQRASQIQNERDQFVTESETLIGDTITLVNYLIDVPTDYLDFSYLDSLIDTANVHLDAVRARQASLSGADSAYSTASERFGQRADAYTKAVRQLQADLKTLTKE